MSAIALDTYVTAARTIAYQMDPVHGSRVDATGHDRCDYEAMLQEKAWGTALGFRSKDAKAPEKDEVRYVCRSMWNELRSFQRSRGRAEARHADLHVDIDDNVGEFNPSSEMQDIEDRIAAREAVRRLQKELRPDDWALALRVFEAYSGDRAASGPVYDASIDTSREALHIRVYRLRKRAKKILAGGV